MTSGAANGPYSAAFTVTASPVRPVTRTRSKMLAPGVVRCEEMTVVTRGCTSTLTRSDGTLHGQADMICVAWDHLLVRVPAGLRKSRGLRRVRAWTGRPEGPRHAGSPLQTTWPAARKGP